MQKDFHYYATYCAAILAGYTAEESFTIAYSAQFVDLCSYTMLKSLGAPVSAATTQQQLEMMDAENDRISLQNITRIWASFHFLPKDLYATKQKKCSKRYLDKYRLICGPNGDLVSKTVMLAKDKSLQAVGLVMHIVADTWAHQYFAGTPSFVINNTNYHFYEVVDDEDYLIHFSHNVSSSDNLQKHQYINTVLQPSENSIMNLGHGRAGHLPDYSYARYKYLPAWGEYEEILKDNPSDYMHAFCQMVYAMKFLRGDYPTFELNRYEDFESQELKEHIHNILCERRLDASDDWRIVGERLSGVSLDEFEENHFFQQYIDAQPNEKNDTFLGKFFLASLAQKSMVTSEIYHSGNPLAGYSIDYNEKGFKGIKDFQVLVDMKEKGDHNE